MHTVSLYADTWPAATRNMRPHRDAARKKMSCYPIISFSLGRRGQSILDYVFLLIIIIALLSVMGYYIRNGLSGKYREGADIFGRGEVYVPHVTGVAKPTIIE